MLRNRWLQGRLWSLVLVMLLGLCGCSSAARQPDKNTHGGPPNGDARPASTGAPQLHRGVLVTALGGSQSVTYEVIDGQAIYQGDINLGRVDERGELLAQPSLRSDRVRRPFAVAVSDTNLIWPGCVIPFELGFDTAANAALAGNIRNAMAAWSTGTSCTFPAHNLERDWVRFQIASINDSNVGRQGGGQDIRLMTSASAGAAMHEIGHAIGLHHEQSRQDRDKFVTVYWRNIISGREDQFQIESGTWDIGVYNYNSIMHYGEFDFSKDKTHLPTLEPTTSGVTIGQRNAPSVGDISGVQELLALREWTPFQRFGVGGPTEVSSPAAGPFRHLYFDTPQMIAGKKVSVPCRRLDFVFPGLGPAECMSTAPGWDLTGDPAVTLTPLSPGEASIFVRAVGTGAYQHFTRDYSTDKAGGAFHTQPVIPVTGWTTSPAAVTIDSRILVFGERVPISPNQSALRMVFKDYGGGPENPHPWSAPIDIPLPERIVLAFDPAVISPRAGVWTLFTFDKAGTLWAVEGDRDGKIVTDWKPIAPLIAPKGEGPTSGPAVALSDYAEASFLVVAAGPQNHLWWLGLGKVLEVRSFWKDVGGLLELDSRPAALGSGGSVSVMARIQGESFWSRQWDPR
jgi:hypothetical protein